MMVPWQVYCFLAGARRENAIQKWLEDQSVPKKQRIIFQEKIDALEQGGPGMVPGFISDTPVAHGIYKMKIKGNKGMKQLRPLCCRGPFASNEFTVLLGAVEKDGKLIPSDAKTKAQSNLRELKSDPTRRVRERLT